MNRQKFDLLYELVRTNFILKYNGSLLGFIWVLLRPFLQFGVLYIVFSSMAGNAQQTNYKVHLLLGLIIYTFISESIISGLTSLSSKAHIILKVDFDKKIAVLSSIVLALVNLIINMVILIPFLINNPVQANSKSMVYFMYVLVILLMSMYAVSFFTSIVSVWLKDLHHLVEVFMQLLFYATPILYQLSSLPSKYQDILKLNPVYIIIDTLRLAFISGQIVNIKEIMFISIASVFVMLLGYTFFEKNIKSLAEKF